MLSVSMQISLPKNFISHLCYVKTVTCGISNKVICLLNCSKKMKKNEVKRQDRHFLIKRYPSLCTNEKKRGTLQGYPSGFRKEENGNRKAWGHIIRDMRAHQGIKDIIYPAKWELMTIWHYESTKLSLQKVELLFVTDGERKTQMRGNEKEHIH